MDHEPYQVRWLLSRLVMAHKGKRAIIIGGGPSAPEQLARIPNWQESVIISANAHALKLEIQPHYVWCKDHIRCKPRKEALRTPREYMEPDVRRLGAPVMGPNYWADYRAIDWPLNNANSGMQALGAAALMGCRPIVPVGMDCFQGSTYFHSPHEDNVSLRRPSSYWNRRLGLIRTALRGAVLRGMGGIPALVFGQYRPEETYSGEVVLPEVLRRYNNRQTVVIRTRREFQDPRDKSAVIPAGYVMASDGPEAERLGRLGLAERFPLFAA